MDSSRLVEVFCEAGGTVGTGYLTTGDTVLTAWHVVRAAGPSGAVEVRVLARPGERAEWRRAIVAWPASAASGGAVDAALLVLEDAGAAGDLAPVRWGRISGDQPVAVTGLGFAEVASEQVPGAGARRRDTLPLRGQLDPLAHAKSGDRQVLLGLTGPLVPARRADGASPWSGASGAALFADGTDVLLAVVAADHELTADARSLLAVPVTALAEAEGFSAVAGSHGIELELLRVDAASVRAAGLAHSALAAADGLEAAVVSAGAQRRWAALDKLCTDLELIHQDYLLMFESILEQAPDAWESGTPGFAERVRETATRLRRLRLTYEAVRVRVRVTAQSFRQVVLPQCEGDFVEAVVAYFPTGELRSDELTGELVTSGTAVLDHLYRSLDGELGQELGTLLRDTLRFHRQRWAELCAAHAAMQISRGTEGLI
ncbi:hypothetical protein P3T36_000985 [Kitasatospora sp. MAP12-15]|uniref:hypothetical protein n=1 Tax=unclassified Kitasatospora TaxID=2633591 RepID=UPI0024753913|nr:hypothetical protein [Kitasatospora sp. MAP12-44]MDH6114586.1 hypothetical protein [Kitasatospora sp. MAP12-44]